MINLEDKPIRNAVFSPKPNRPLVAAKLTEMRRSAPKRLTWNVDGLPEMWYFPADLHTGQGGPHGLERDRPREA